ncbi:MAG: hypothetical protein IIC33_00355 [Chloroflexi bacterium]|nr:hypothetical protein [Chloroflexota bacterium]
MESSQAPELSIVIVIASDTTEPKANLSLLTQCLKGLTQQMEAPSNEVIVPYDPRTVDGIDALRTKFAEITFLDVGHLKTWSGGGGGREHHDELKTLGLNMARGRIVGFLEDNEIPDRAWCAETVKAHQADYAGIGGAIDNSLDRVLNWAVYFCDFGRYQNPVFPGESANASDANVSYKRSALDAVRTAWEGGFNEVTVNAALMNQGGKLALSPEIVVRQHRQGLRFWPALRERYVWGRSFGSVRCQVIGNFQRAVLTILSPILPGLVAVKMARTAAAKRRNMGKFCQAFPLILLLLSCWGLGEFLGYVTRRPAGNSKSQ